MIKMLQASNEANILQEINEIIAGIEHCDDNSSFRRFGEMDLLSIFHSHNRFANSLFEGIDLQFIPLYVITRLGIRHFNITRNNYTSYKEFIKNNQQAFKTLHEIIRKHYFNQEGRDKNYYEERVKEILLAESSITRPSPLNLNSLLKSIYLRVYNFPYLPETNFIYEFYLRNLPGSVVRTQLRDRRIEHIGENVDERVKRLPFKSKLKVNAYANKYHWNDLQKELARGTHLSDYFNLKNNLKYQLKAVAPRHTLIIDLFFPGRFVYLLAINVNTRKAFAIPSPLITKLNDSF